VIDGDTIELATGERVRLIGIDTPERGVCGFSEASERLSGMVTGRVVTLSPGARDDVDHYDRLLRYVDVDGVDAGLVLINEGYAIARYDSRDGYGRHDREDLYVGADQSSEPKIDCNVGGGVSGSTGSPGGDLDPRFDTCGEALDNGFGNYVRGQDPEYDWYRDGDSDGVACEG
jgi:hypothetical protein